MTREEVRLGRLTENAAGFRREAPPEPGAETTARICGPEIREFTPYSAA